LLPPAWAGIISAMASAMRRARSWVGVMAMTAIAAVGYACGGGSSEGGPALSVTPDAPTLGVGESVQLSALNARGTIAWTSSDATIAEVVSTGFVTAKKPGTATITAADDRGSATATVTVRRPAALGLSTNALAFTTAAGGVEPPAQTVQLTDAGDAKVSGIAVAGVTYGTAQPTGWLTATVAATTAPTTLTVRAAPGALPAGVYTATISVSAIGATNGAQSVVVTFTVTAPATLVLSATTATFNGTRGAANPAAQTVNITNGGGGTISGLAATITYQAGQPTGWLTATLGATNAPAVLTLQAATGSLADGTYGATVSVAGTGATNSPRTIAVTFVVGTAPSIALSSAAVTFNADVTGAAPPAQTIAVTNAGGGTLSGLGVTVTYAASQPTGWLTTASLDQTTAPATLTLRPTQTGLAVGTYGATVTLAAAAASNSPRTIAVTLVVASVPNLVVGSTAIAVSVTRGTIGQTLQVPVTRQGGGAIGGLTAAVAYQSGSGWLTATLSQTTTPATLSLQPSAAFLTGGQTYVATVSVATPNAGNSPQTITVTLTVLYSLATDIYPAIRPFCVGCHFGGGNQPNLSTADAFYDNLVDIATSDRTYPLANTHPLRIKVDDAASSYVIDQLEKAAGANPMPTSPASRVPQATIDALKFWINHGAPRN
jgi:Big-like domain-containing protein